MQPINFECNLDILKAYEDKGRWIVEGLAATSDFDLQEDIITQHAIENSAKDLLENSTVLHNHNPNEAIGKVERSEARRGGLWLKIFVSKTVPDIWQKIKEGVLNKFSIRGKILEAKKQWIPHLKKYARLIFKMHLIEVSLVAVPANPKARTIRWYVEKALERYESDGGELEVISSEEIQNQIYEKGGLAMQKDMEVLEEELLEASGEPEVEDGNNNTSKGFPPPEQLWEEWKNYCNEKELLEKSQDQVWEAWIEFCKQRGYPYPYPYPYPRTGIPQDKQSQIMFLIDKLIAGEKDEKRKVMLQEIKAILSRLAGGSYPYPQAKKNEESNPGNNDDLEKAGRKISKNRLSKLKKLLEELQQIIAEAEPNQVEEKKDNQDEDDLIKKLNSLEETMKKITETLGMTEHKDKDGKDEKNPTLAETIQRLSKRLDAIEGIPAIKTSIDGQDPLASEKKEKSLWKGLI